MAYFTPRYVDYDFLDEPILSSSSTDIISSANFRDVESLRNVIIDDYILPWDEFRDFEDDLQKQFQKGKGKKLKSLIERVIGKPIKEGNYITYKERDLLKSSNALKKYFEDGYISFGKGSYKDLSKISESSFDKLKTEVKTKLSGKVSSTQLNRYLGNMERMFSNKEKPKSKFVQLLLKDVPRIEPDGDGDLRLWVMLSNLNKEDEDGVVMYSYKDLKQYLQNPEKFDIVVSPTNTTEKKVVENFIAYSKQLGKEFEVLPPGKGVVKLGNFDGGVLQKNQTSKDTPHNLGDQLLGDRPEMEALEYMSTLVKEKPLSGIASEEDSKAVMDFKMWNLTKDSYDDSKYDEKIETKLKKLSDIGRFNIDQVQKSPKIYFLEKNVYLRMFDPSVKNAEALKRLIYSDGRTIKRRNRRKNVTPPTGFTFEHIIPINIIIDILKLVKKESPNTFSMDSKKILNKLYKICWVSSSKDSLLDTSNKANIPTTLAKKIGIEELKKKTKNEDGEERINYQLSNGVNIRQMIQNIERLSDDDTLLRYQRLGIGDLVPMSQVFKGGTTIELENYTNEELKLPSNIVPEQISLAELLGY